MKSNLARSIAAIVICELAGVVGSVSTAGSVSSWYPTLTKPALNPPAWIFAPVWTLLYALMGIAAFLVWRAGAKQARVRRALVIFGAQLVLNMLWSVIFFGLHRPGLALAEIALLWLAILATMLSFRRISRTASYLLLPYLAWVSFAAYLNFSIWLHN